jgi:hypothetical protein
MPGIGFIIFCVITILCLIPFGWAVFYFIIGVRSYSIGKRENSRPKISGGITTILLSLAGMLLVIILWRWLI